MVHRHLVTSGSEKFPKGVHITLSWLKKTPIIQFIICKKFESEQLKWAWISDFNKNCVVDCGKTTQLQEANMV